MGETIGGAGHVQFSNVKLDSADPLNLRRLTCDVAWPRAKALAPG